VPFVVSRHVCANQKSPDEVVKSGHEGGTVCMRSVVLDDHIHYNRCDSLYDTFKGLGFGFQGSGFRV